MTVINQTGDPVFLDEFSGAYEGTHFVLLYPRGETGWHKRMAAAPSWTAPTRQRRQQHQHQHQQQQGGNAPQAEEQPPEQQEHAHTRNDKHLSVREYAAYFMHDRCPADNFLMVHGKRLFQEWMIDEYCRVESEKLLFYRAHQQELRADLYVDVVHAVDAHQDAHPQPPRNGEAPPRIGRFVLLPPSFSAGPRHMTQLYQDAMGIVRAKGKPDLFITFTSNPSWPELLRELKPGETVNDRPDLVDRAFRLKLDMLLTDLFVHGVFGRVVGDIHVIEYQKRGLPHAHILVCLHPDDKLRTVDDYDRVVSARLPDKQEQPELYNIVTRSLIHGPCGVFNQSAPCMAEGVCEKHFPKAWQEQTVDAGDSYPLYCRPDDGRFFDTSKGRLDNRWVVPHSPWLTLRYNAHINVEVCASVSAVKYLYKYVYKGHDRVRVVVTPDAAVPMAVQVDQQRQGRDEIKDFVDGRYVSASEAAWRLFGMSMQGQHPNVCRLAVHLQGQQTVFFQADRVADVPVHGAPTTLTQWFAFNATAESAYQRECVAAAAAGRPAPVRPECLSLLYHEIPEVAVWDARRKVWKPRRSWGPTDVRHLAPVGRMYAVHPSDQERFHLRMLLCHVPGATSYEQLRTFNGTQYGTFKAACIARGLLQDDSEWAECMRDAAVSQHPSALRALFASLLVFNGVQKPAELWGAFQADMCEDLLHTARALNPARSCDLGIQHQALRDIDLHILQLTGGSKSLSDWPDMPTYARVVAQGIVAEERGRYVPEVQAAARDVHVSKLNEQQCDVYNTVMDAVRTSDEGEHEGGAAFFVDGLGGSGKTFLYEAVLHGVRAEGKVAVAVASSGIAALLLEGGRTAHSRFKVPVQGLGPTSTCNISTHTQLADLIQQASVIVWDEAPMMHRHVFEAVDRTLCDIMADVAAENQYELFGGKVMVMGVISGRFCPL